MPWAISKRNDKYCVVKDINGTRETVKCHPNRAAALAHLKALYANVPDAKAWEEEMAAVLKEAKK